MIIVGSPLWTLIRQSDSITWAILIALLCLSLLSWTVAIYKIAWFQWHKKRLKSTIGILKRVVSLRDVSLLGQAADLFKRANMAERIHQHILRQASSTAILREELNALLADQIAQAEEQVIILKIAAEASPLLGLLGTIWGLIHAFIRISLEKSADIVIVAPGIAEALITTLMGLLVAIPALLFFHAVTRHAAVYEQLLCICADQCDRIARDLDHSEALS